MATLLFAPATYNLAETTRMLEVARACRGRFEVAFGAFGGDFEHLIDDAGFTVHRLEPRLTPAKVKHLYEVDRGEKIGVMFTEAETEARVQSELALYREVSPTAVVTGWNLTVPLSARIAHVPLVWVIQSTWLPESGMGMVPDRLPRALRRPVTRLVSTAANTAVSLTWFRPLNRVARRHGVAPFRSLMDFWRGDHTLLAEPPGFSLATHLPPSYHATGPLIAREDFPIPPEVLDIPRDRPLVYFAMGSSGQAALVANILHGFAGAPFRVIAPVRSHLAGSGFEPPGNVLVTDWLPAHLVNPMADLSVIHGGIGTVMTAALAGKPVVGVGMQPEQVANLDCLVRRGFAVRIPRRKANAARIIAAAGRLLADEDAQTKARAFAVELAQWDGPQRSAQFLATTFGGEG
jgi:UDP:flavonoid glycosyltransferase YjiC (YdhE family)